MPKKNEIKKTEKETEEKVEVKFENPINKVQKEEETLTGVVKPQPKQETFSKEVIKPQLETKPFPTENEPKEEVLTAAVESKSQPEVIKTVEMPIDGPSEIPQQDSEEDQKPSEGSKKFLFIGLVVFAVLILAGGGVFVYQKAMKEAKKASESTPVVDPSPAPTDKEETPEPSPTATSATKIKELKREDFKIQALNGSGIPGTAGKAKAFLEGLGYQGVEAGNADSYDYEETEVSIKEEKKDYLDLLTKDLEKEYTLSTQAATLDKNSEFDAVVIIGKE